MTAYVTTVQQAMSLGKGLGLPSLEKELGLLSLGKELGRHHMIKSDIIILNSSDDINVGPGTGA
ncbi:hypothetical protein SLEP1_g51547 [Rubroshorea leprosula]|uniref:Uncharacterized protein n=1 Tax=Rubroshorea leprosula TaxID=152421 RepID=A0AAV5M4B4_9ROSI|nr:hypothetical protein SLEP1_g51547 [Rubroshorea leprosula]